MLNHGEVLAAIERAIEDARAVDGRCAVLILRTQRLRELEQTHGYAAVDRQCRNIGMRLDDMRRPVDILVRIGTCDYALVMPRLLNAEQVKLAATKAMRLLSTPGENDGDGVCMRTLHAVGAAIWPDHAETAEALCLRAEAACSRAMRGQRKIVVSDAPDHASEVGYGELFAALHGNALQVFLQPIFRVDDGRLLGFESLARWHLPGRGWIAPDRFVELAERTHLISELTQWSLNTTLRLCAPVLARHPHLTCAINLSADMMDDDSIVEQISAALRLWDVRPASLVVEVTETRFVGDAGRVSEMLHALKRLGVGIAIDDFGSGFASWGYLQHFPVDLLKIDRSFIGMLSGSERGTQLVSAMVDLAHRIGAQAIAEGVEDEETLDLLRALGCDQQQGYLLGRPMPAQQALALAGQD